MRAFSFLLLMVSVLTAADQTPPATKTSADANVQKQRETTIAAMQSSLEKQKAAVAASVGASIGKQGQGLAPKGSFFTLAPLTPPQPQPTVSMPDVSCDPVPEDSVAPMVLDAAQRESLDPKLVTAVIEQESGFRPCAISDKGAQGLMQLMPGTASKLGVENPFDPSANVNGGTQYLRELLDYYHGDMAKTLAAYNAGPQRVAKYHGVPPYRETHAYVARIIREFNRKKLAEQRAQSARRKQLSGSGSRQTVSNPARVTGRPAQKQAGAGS